jgi:hypothetical protein
MLEAIEFIYGLFRKTETFGVLKKTWALNTPVQEGILYAKTLKFLTSWMCLQFEA